MYTNRALNIAIIEDDSQMIAMLSDFLSDKFPLSKISAFKTGEEALSKLTEPQDLVVLDYNLDSVDAKAIDGIQVLKKLKEKYPVMPVIFLSGQESAVVASNTIKYGAWDYIIKNESSFLRLEIHINNILGNFDLRKNLGAQKFFNRLLAFLVLAMIVGMVVMRMGN